MEVDIGGGIGELMEFKIDADLGGGFFLIFGVNEGSGIVPDDHGGEADGFAMGFERQRLRRRRCRGWRRREIFRR